MSIAVLPWASLDRRQQWLVLPDAQRWVTIFLDLDEVLCVAKPHIGFELLKALERGENLDQQVLDSLFSAQARDVLERIHEDFGGRISYAISSSWREHFKRDQLELVFRSAGLALVADHLHEGAAWRCPSPVASSPYSTGSAPIRVEEIELWLRYFHAGEPFVAIDDEESGWSLATDKLP